MGLLSDMEFLLFKGPQSGQGMYWDKAINYIRGLHRFMAWGGTKVTIVSGQCTIKQAKIDLQYPGISLGMHLRAYGHH